jgi:hypothetical protein
MQSTESQIDLPGLTESAYQGLCWRSLDINYLLSNVLCPSRGLQPRSLEGTPVNRAPLCISNRLQHLTEPIPPGCRLQSQMARQPS